MSSNFLMALTILFLLMAGLFRSLKDSAIVALTIPLAGVGGVIALRLLNLFSFQPMDLLTMIGFIILLGLVVNNAILLVDQTRRAERAGLSRDQAVEQALEYSHAAYFHEHLHQYLRHAAARSPARRRERDLSGAGYCHRWRHDLQPVLHPADVTQPASHRPETPTRLIQQPSNWTDLPWNQSPDRGMTHEYAFLITILIRSDTTKLAGHRIHRRRPVSLWTRPGQDTFSASLWVSGTVISRNDARIAAETDGRITWVAEVGSRIEAGQPFATIDDTDLRLELRDNQAQLESLRRTEALPGK